MPLRVLIYVLLFSAQIFAQAPSGHPGVEFITPAGDPKKSPSDSGDGQNEFTYDTATPGVLRLNLKGKDSEMKNSDGSSRYEYKFSFASGVGDSSGSWESGYEGGKAKLVGSNEFEAKGKFTTLPTTNDAFGEKTAKIFRKKTGESDWAEVASQDFEVFFPKDATNHPGTGAGSAPNWFFYWTKFVTLGSIQTLNFSSGAGYASTNPVTRITTITQAASEGNDETTHSGIHTFYETVAHESHHIVLWEGWWGRGGRPTSALDTDNDTYPDSFESGSSGVAYGFQNGRDDDYASGAATTMSGARWPTDSSGYNYEENECRQIEHSLRYTDFDSQDWSYDSSNANQGKQHR